MIISISDKGGRILETFYKTHIGTSIKSQKDKLFDDFVEEMAIYGLKEYSRSNEFAQYKYQEGLKLELKLQNRRKQKSLFKEREEND